MVRLKVTKEGNELRKGETVLPLTPTVFPMDGIFSECGRENDCNKCTVEKHCVLLHDNYVTKGVLMWEANIKFLELRRKAGYANSRSGEVILIC